jgi:ATP synthase protein I
MTEPPSITPIGHDAQTSRDRARAEAMQRVVLRKSLRRRRARETQRDSVWTWLGTFGLVGWTVIVPTLAGLAFGVFLDSRLDSSISFAITFLVLGVGVGLSMAWYWVHQESQGDNET